MSLYKRGSVWWSRIEKDSRVIQRSTKCATKENARKVEAAWRTADALGEVGLGNKLQKIPLHKFMEERFFTYNLNRVAPRTALYYKTNWVAMSTFIPLATAPIQRIDSSLIEQFVQHRIAEGVLPATVNNSLKTLRRALHLAYEWKLINRVPKVKMLAGERQREFIIDEAMLAKMVSMTSPVMKQLIPFLIDTGLRIGEATDLTWATVSLEPKEGAARGWVYVEKGKSRYAKRYVPLTERAASILAERKAAKGTSQWVWMLDKHKRLQAGYASQMFKKFSKKLELPWDAVLHSTRHSFCTRLGESGVDAFTIQKLAGHSNITISQRYVHPTGPRLEGAIGLLEASTLSAASKAQQSATA